VLFVGSSIKAEKCTYFVVGIYLFEACRGYALQYAVGILFLAQEEGKRDKMANNECQIRNRRGSTIWSANYI
jgi:hypothetical protein